jgi:hypothetical protein
MIELKVHCDCGQKYKFDVEPVNNQMPFTVACPICRQDGTPKANVLLQQMSIFKQVEPAPASATAPPPAPMRVSPASAAPAPAPIAPLAPPPPAGPSKLRINAAAHAAPAAPSGDAPPAIAPVAGSAPPPIGARPRLGAAPAATADEPGKKPPSFMMGLLGAFIGALAGTLLYYGTYMAAGTLVIFVGRYFLALGVGALAGWLANLLGRGEGSKELGGLAAVFTVVGILAAQYLVAADRWHKAMGTNEEISQAIADGGYSESVKEGKKVVTAVPTGSDAEIRMYLAKEQAEPGQAPKLEQISSDEVQQFRNEELTNYQDLASGRLTKEQYWAKNNFDPNEAKKIADTEDSTVKSVFILLTVSRLGIISMIAGAGLAFRLSANA